jgi:hypothetical protein
VPAVRQKLHLSTCSNLRSRLLPCSYGVPMHAICSFEPTQKSPLSASQRLAYIVAEISLQGGKVELPRSGKSGKWNSAFCRCLVSGASRSLPRASSNGMKKSGREGSKDHSGLTEDRCVGAFWESGTNGNAARFHGAPASSPPANRGICRLLRLPGAGAVFISTHTKLSAG